MLNEPTHIARKKLYFSSTFKEENGSAAKSLHAQQN
jgi:hypothetical protein